LSHLRKKRQKLSFYRARGKAKQIEKSEKSCGKSQPGRKTPAWKKRVTFNGGVGGEAVKGEKGRTGEKDHGGLSKNSEQGKKMGTRRKPQPPTGNGGGQNISTGLGLGQVASPLGGNLQRKKNSVQTAKQEGGGVNLTDKILCKTKNTKCLIAHPGDTCM